MTDNPEHLDKTEARAGNSVPVNRVVLIVSLVLVAAAFAVLLLLNA